MPSAPVVLIDPNWLFREGLRALLRGTEHEVVAEAPGLDGAAALPGMAAEARLVLCDPAGSSAEEAIGALRALFPDARVVVLSAALDPAALAAAIRAGADGCLLKDISPDALAQSLRLVLMGEKVFPSALAALLAGGGIQDAVPAPASSRGLSPREVEILRRLVEGESNKMVANRLGITEATVKVHLKSLLRKIGAANRTQAAIWALNNGVGEDARSLETA